MAKQRMGVVFDPTTINKISEFAGEYRLGKAEVARFAINQGLEFLSIATESLTLEELYKLIDSKQELNK